MTGSSTPTGSVNQTRAAIYSWQSIGSRESSPRPRKIGELVADLLANGFAELGNGGKGSHRTFAHDRYRGALTLSGQSGDDAKPYQAHKFRKAMEANDEDDCRPPKKFEWKG